MRRIMLDQQLDERLRSDGYVVVPFLSSEQVSALNSDIDDLRPSDQFDPSASGLDSSATYHCTFLDASIDYKDRTQRLVRRFFQRGIDRFLDAYEILTSNIYVKPPGTGRFEIHQNWPTLEDLALTSLTVWVPLQDVGEINSTLRVVPGSHKIVPDIATAQEPPFFKSFERELIEDHLVPLRLPAGHAVIFDDTLLHWSAENSSTRPRRAIQVELVPSECQPVLYYLSDGETGKSWELFEVDDRFFIEHSIREILNRPVMLRSAGRAPYRNRPIDLAQFCSLLEEGRQIRSSVYSGLDWPGR